MGLCMLQQQTVAPWGGNPCALLFAAVTSTSAGRMVWLAKKPDRLPWNLAHGPTLLLLLLHPQHTLTPRLLLMLVAVNRYEAARARFCRGRTPEALTAFTTQLDREWAWLAHCRRAATAAGAAAAAAAGACALRGPGAAAPLQRCLRSQHQVGRSCMCAVLCCAVLCCAVLCCAVLCCVVYSPCCTQ
jgi:hypothetical protein